MKKIVLSEEDIKNLTVFLNRVDMKGATEAIAMVQIVTAIAQAEANENVNA